MPTYEADLEWLKKNYPAEYKRIPDGVVTDSTLVQRHMSAIPDNGIMEPWIIAFFPADEDSDVESVFVELGIERPAPEDVTIPLCKMHTLRVSREFCPQCRETVTEMLERTT